MNRSPAIFIDRDGTLVEEVNYLSRLEDLKLFDFTARSIEALKEREYLVIVVTNQSGIARGIYDEADMHGIHHAIQTSLGGLIDAFYFCPHLPDGECSCRKPLTGMLEMASRDFEIDLSRSWMIGDKLIDVQTGRNAGVRSLLVRTGYGAGHEAMLNGEVEAVVDDLGAACSYILQNA